MSFSTKNISNPFHEQLKVHEKHHISRVTEELSTFARILGEEESTGFSKKIKFNTEEETPQKSTSVCRKLYGNLGHFALMQSLHSTLTCEDSMTLCTMST